MLTKQCHLSLAITFIAGLLVASCIGVVSVSAKTLTDKQIQKVATQLLRDNSSDWGLSNKQFVVQRTITTSDGLSTVRFGQVLAGIPVLNSLVAITLTTDGRFVSQNHVVSDASISPTIRLKARQVKKIGSQYLAKDLKVSELQVAIFRIQPVVADPRLTANLVTSPSVVWALSVTNKQDVTTASTLMISDVSGEVLVQQSLVKSAIKPTYPDPLVCDLQASQPSGKLANKISSGVLNGAQRKWVGQLSGYPLCEKNDPARISNSSSAIQSIDETVNFYWNKLGVDISSEYYLGNISPLANFGKNVDAASYCDSAQSTAKDPSCIPAISGFTNVCVYDAKNKGVDCPMENAFWVPWNSTECRSGACSGIFFGAGFDVADDVVAHELTHGVSSADAFFDGLCDNCEADGISEALSDIFGEAVDQLNPSPGESPDPNWGMGEDVSGGPFRNMAMVGTAKPCSSSSDWIPVKQIDATWDPACDSHNSLGPADRLAWLLANGGKQNGIQVQPLGTAPWGLNGKYELCKSDSSNCTAIINVSRLFFQSLKKLNGNITYSSFGEQVSAACTDLTKARSKPFPASYCVQVKNALAATGISKLSLIMTTRPTSAKAKTAVVVAGKFSATNGTPATGANVALQFRPTNASTWTTLKSVTTSTTGSIRTTVTFPSSGSYRLVSVSNSQVGKYLSATTNVLVR